MKSISLIASLAGLTFLTACGDGTPFQNDDPIAVGSAALSGDTYTITQGDTVINLAAGDSLTIGGQRVWLNVGDRAQAYESDNVLAIGGAAADGTPFAGITGMSRDAPMGDAVFVGGFGVLSGEDAYNSGDLTLNFDLATGALTNDGGALGVDATATELGINGTVTFGGEEGTLVGNFYGTDEVAGAFTGDEIGGVIFGTEQ